MSDLRVLYHVEFKGVVPCCFVFEDVIWELNTMNLDGVVVNLITLWLRHIVVILLLSQ